MEEYNAMVESADAELGDFEDITVSDIEDIGEDLE